MAFLKLSPDFPAADELRQEAVVAPFVADAAGDDGGWMSASRAKA